MPPLSSGLSGQTASRNQSSRSRQQSKPMYEVRMLLNENHREAGPSPTGRGQDREASAERSGEGSNENLFQHSLTRALRFASCSALSRWERATYLLTLSVLSFVLFS